VSQNSAVLRVLVAWLLWSLISLRMGAGGTVTPSGRILGTSTAPRRDDKEGTDQSVESLSQRRADASKAAAKVTGGEMPARDPHRSAEHSDASRDEADRDEALLRTTIETYDIIASEYADRFSRVDLAGHRKVFTELIPPGNRLVLDAGCGPGRDCELLSQDGLLAIGIDKSSGLLREAKKNTSAPLIFGDIRRLPFGDRTFSGVWSCASLVHLSAEQASKAIAEFHRVLRPGGTMFLSVREGHGVEPRPEASGRFRWFHLYSSSTVARLLSHAGFDIVSIETAAGLVGGKWVNVYARRTEDGRDHRTGNRVDSREPL
jgi:SAM-dependent methyltransferase